MASIKSWWTSSYSVLSPKIVAIQEPSLSKKCPSNQKTLTTKFSKKIPYIHITHYTLGVRKSLLEKSEYANERFGKQIVSWQNRYLPSSYLTSLWKTIFLWNDKYYKKSFVIWIKIFPKYDTTLKWCPLLPSTIMQKIRKF